MNLPDKYAGRMLRHFMTESERGIVNQFAKLPHAERVPCDSYTGCRADAVYVPGSRADRVLLVAHYDTVWGRSKIRLLQRGYILYSGRKRVGIGADDRAGITALWLLRHLDGHSLLILPAEECGCLGAHAVADAMPEELARHQFAMQFDRRGDRDIVTYDCDNPKFDCYLKEALPGYKLADGSFSDISVLCPEARIAGANVSIGFEHEHTPFERLDVLDFFRTVQLVRTLLRRRKLKRWAYVESPHSYGRFMRQFRAAPADATSVDPWDIDCEPNASPHYDGADSLFPHWCDDCAMAWCDGEYEKDPDGIPRCPDCNAGLI